MQKLFEGGKGNVFQRVLSWIPSNNHQLQLAGALAIANFARNGKHIVLFLKVKCSVFFFDITCAKTDQFRIICSMYVYCYHYFSEI